MCRLIGDVDVDVDVDVNVDLDVGLIAPKPAFAHSPLEICTRTVEANVNV